MTPHVRVAQGDLAGALAAGTALWVLCGALLGSLGAGAKWAFSGRLEPHAGFNIYDSLSFRRALVLISELPLGEPPHHPNTVTRKHAMTALCLCHRVLAPTPCHVLRGTMVAPAP